MPFTPPVATGAIVVGLASVAQIGSGAVKLATAIANGMATWLQALPVITADVGTLGAGAGTIPLVVPTPVLIAALLVTFAGQDILGPMAPLTILGISNGITIACAQALVITTHPLVGSGTAVVKFGSSPATPPMIAAFAAQQMTTIGSIKMATAIGQGLDTTFAALVLPSPIVGSASPIGSGGAGFGKVV